jgi:hypothetical protein
MFKEIAGFFIILLIVKIALPKEIGDLMTDILLKVLTLIKDVISQVPTS